MLPVAIMVNGPEIFIMPLGFCVKHFHNYCHFIQVLLTKGDLQLGYNTYSKRALVLCLTEICFVPNSLEFVSLFHWCHRIL